MNECVNDCGMEKLIKNIYKKYCHCLNRDFVCLNLKNVIFLKKKERGTINYFMINVVLIKGQDHSS